MGIHTKMPEIFYVECSSDDESSLEPSAKDGRNAKVIVSTREVKKIEDSNQLMLATFADKEKATLAEIEALKKCNDYWKDIAQTRSKNIETMNVALASQARRIHELETSISDAKSEELRAKKARFDTCKPQLDSTSTQYGIIVHGIPTTMNLCSKEEIQFFQDENSGLLKSLQSIKWINAKSLHGGKVNSSIVIFLSNSEDFEILLQRKSILYGAQSKPVKKFVANFEGGKRRCFKCEGVGHLARDCNEPDNNEDEDDYDDDDNKEDEDDYDDDDEDSEEDRYWGVYLPEHSDYC